MKFTTKKITHGSQNFLSSLIHTCVYIRNLAKCQEKFKYTKGVIRICKIEGQTTQRTKEKGIKDKQRSTKYYI